MYKNMEEKFKMATKINSIKLQEIREKLDSTLSGISKISILKKSVENSLKEVIGEKNAKEVFKTKSIDHLNSEETILFLQVIFNKVGDDSFNPEHFMTSSTAKGDKEVFFFYNTEFKELFLEQHRTKSGKPYAEETKRVNRFLFNKTAVIEKLYNEDLYTFDSVKFEELLKTLKATTIRSLQNSISTMEQYIDFAIKHKNLDQVNIATQYNNRDSVDAFLDKKAEENMFFEKKEIDYLAEYAENAQDGVILNLIFDGVSNKNRFQELINIKESDVDYDSLVINIPEMKTGDEISPARVVPISSTTARMIRKAMDFDEKYVSTKGLVSRSYKIAQSEYILRGLRDNAQILWNNVNQRILRIAKLSDHEYLTATNVSYSGQVHYAREKMAEGKSQEEAIAYVIKRFNLSDNESTQFYIRRRMELAEKVLR